MRKGENIMAGFVKKCIILILVVTALAASGYGIFRLYHYVVQDVTSRVKKGVSEGVTEGVTGVINPLSWPKKIFGG